MPSAEDCIGCAEDGLVQHILEKGPGDWYCESCWRSFKNQKEDLEGLPVEELDYELWKSLALWKARNVVKEGACCCSKRANDAGKLANDDRADSGDIAVCDLRRQIAMIHKFSAMPCARNGH